MSDPANARISLRPHDLALAVLPLMFSLLGVYLILRLIAISSNFLVLVCAAGLLALALNQIASLVESRVGLPRKIGVLLLLGLLVGGMVTAAYLAGAQVVDQYAQLAQELPRAADNVRARLSNGPLGSYLEPALSKPFGGFEPSRAFGSFSTWFGTAAGAISSLFFFLAISLYLSVQPELYIKGFLKLLKRDQWQTRAREVLDDLYDRLGKFLLAAALQMSLIGILTTLGLWALGIDYALALGLTAGLLCFIPVIGPALSFLPALLVGLAQGSEAALKVTVLFAIIQLVESNVITPLIQKKLADVPPVLLLLAQAVAGVLFGFVGIALAAPAVVVLMVLVEQFHLKPGIESSTEISVGAVETVPKIEESRNRGPAEAGLSHQ
jgi:predicted PurR-regulated permease PerM